MLQLDVALWAVAGYWLGFTVNRLRAIRAIPLLPALDPGAVRGAAPRVSVIVAARNEEARIGRTLELLLGQERVELQVIVVDDRSTDATPGILHRCAARDVRLEVLRVDTLPPGWLGKPHACHVAAARARGAWLLFTDADAWMDPDLIARAIGAAERARADHVCLYPREATPSLLGRAVLALLVTAVAPLSAAVNRDRRRGFFGVGAFNLVRAEAYRSVGGHARLCLEVVDDMKLGLLLSRAGSRTRVLDASRHLEVHWAPTLRGLLRAVEKNAFALFDFRLGLATAAITLPVLLWSAAVLGPLSGSPAGLAAAVALATSSVPALVFARRGRLGVLAGLLAPLMVPAAVAATAHSVVRTLRASGITWRGTFHPLAELRRGLVPWTKG